MESFRFSNEFRIFINKKWISANSRITISVLETLICQTDAILGSESFIKIHTCQSFAIESNIKPCTHIELLCGIVRALIPRER